MALVQKIQTQTFTSSLLKCPIQNQQIMVWATWFRKNEDYKLQIKKERVKNQTICFYKCSMMDFGCYVVLELEDLKREKFIYEYGPIKLDLKIQHLFKRHPSNSQSLPISVQLGKNKKMDGKISISQKQKQKFSLLIDLQKIQLQLQYPKLKNWFEYEQIFGISGEHPQLIKFYLHQNKNKVKKQLQNINIYSHTDNFINLIFVCEETVNLFLTKILYNVHLKQQHQLKLQRYPSQDVLAQVNNLFASSDFISNSATPEVPQSILQDFRLCLNTPKAEIQQQMRQKRWTNFDGFLSNQNDQTQHQKQLQNMGTHQTIGQQIQSIQQSVQQQIQGFPHLNNKMKKQAQSQKIQFNLKQTKSLTKLNSHQFLFDKQKVHQSKQNSVQKTSPAQFFTKMGDEQKYTYGELLTISKYLEEQNKKLIIENIKLKAELIKAKSSTNNKGKIYKAPQFIKKKNDHKTQQKSELQQKNSALVTSRNSGIMSLFRHTFNVPISKDRKSRNRFQTQGSPNPKKMMSSCYNQKTRTNKLHSYHSTDLQQNHHA